MNCSVALRSLCLLLWALAACSAASAAEPECMRYVPQIGKQVAVPCDELRSSAPSPKPESPAASPESAAPAQPPPISPAAAAPTPSAQEDKALTKLKKNLVELTEALNSTSGDSAFRDSFCTLLGTAQWLHEVKEEEVQKRLMTEHEALEQKLGDRGRNVYAAVQQDVMKLVLDTPVGASADGTRLEQTPEGQAFVKARDGLHMACNCMREAALPKRIVCCDSCDKETLQQKGDEKNR